jgi:hypothetical protein
MTPLEMPVLHRGQLQFKVLRRPFAGMMVPPVGEQHIADDASSHELLSTFLVEPFFFYRTPMPR